MNLKWLIFNLQFSINLQCLNFQTVLFIIIWSLKIQWKLIIVNWKFIPSISPPLSCPSNFLSGHYNCRLSCPVPPTDGIFRPRRIACLFPPRLFLQSFIAAWRRLYYPLPRKSAKSGWSWPAVASRIECSPSWRCGGLPPRDSSPIGINGCPPMTGGSPWDRSSPAV